ncbi:MAG: hypothetical protein ACYTGL_13185 [Planctomycetota bacterium]
MKLTDLLRLLLPSQPEKTSLLWGVLIVLATTAESIGQVDIEKPPIDYSKTQDDNLVTKLKARIESGETTLEPDSHFGFLRPILKELDVSVTSQGLVFSKTSLQVEHIATRNPRAIYFNDDVYVGWVRGSNLIELSVSDAKLGAAFYSAEQIGSRLRIRRRDYDCLACHATSMTQGVPGHTVRSVFPRHDGSFDFRRKSFVTDHKSPFKERWGGWYVTGLHGDMQHMGNAVLSGTSLRTTNNANLEDLRDRLFTLDWLSSYSDIVALMVLEHQTQMHNTLTKNNFIVRRALYEHQRLDPAKAEAERKELELTIDNAAKNIVEYMLFLDETRLTSEIRPSTRFVSRFTRRGPADDQGRSLREFNLRTRLFEYPCSYMIYSDAFATLESALLERCYHRLWTTLNAEAGSDEFPHLSDEMRAAIREIIWNTKTDLPSYWMATD